MVREIVHALPVAARRRLFRLFLTGAYALARALPGGSRRQPDVRESIEGRPVEQMPRRLCIFAHYDRMGHVDPHVFYLLQKLRQAGVETVFVTTASSFRPEDLEALREICVKLIRRENFGADFGSWKAGLSSVENLEAYSSMILANDSVYGPFSDIGNLLDTMSRDPGDFWGITESLEGGRHVQSYFLFFKQAVFLHSAFRDYWRDLTLFRGKRATIHAGEIGLSQMLEKAGFSSSVLIKDTALRVAFPEAYATAQAASVSGDINPSRMFWQTAIEQFKAPFLKVDIVRDDADVAPDIQNWRNVIEMHSDYDPRLIEAHVQRVRSA